MTRPEKVVGGVWRALKPGGRFVGEFGRFGNVVSIVTVIEAALSPRSIVMPNPWYFPLEFRGFVIRSIFLLPRQTPLSGDIRGWLETFAQPYLLTVPPDQKQEFLSEIIAALRPVLCDAQGYWQADYLRLRFAATKPG